METKTNIWDQFNFKERSGKSAYEYLVDQKNSFIAKSGGILSIEVESKNSTDYQTMTYTLYVVAKHLGGYRKEIFQVLESDRSNFFPVTIMSTGLSDVVFSFVPEKDFLTRIEEMIMLPTIKRTIENLYQQSKENIYDNNQNK